MLPAAAGGSVRRCCLQAATCTELRWGRVATPVASLGGAVSNGGILPNWRCASSAPVHFETYQHRRERQEELEQRPRRQPVHRSRKGLEDGGDAPPPELRRLLSDARRAAQARDWQEVKATLSQVPDNPPGPEWAPLYYAVLACLCREGCYFEAMAVWDEMPARDEAAYNMLINMCGRVRQLETAKTLFQEMPAQGLSQTGVTYCALLSALAAQARHQEAAAVLEEMKALPRLDAATDWDQVYLLVSSATARSGLAARVGELLAEAQKDRGVVLRHHHYNTMIVACAKNAEADKAAVVLADMRASGLEPREMDMNVYIQCCRGDFPRCQAALLDIKKPSEETFAALLYAALACPRETMPAAADWVLAELKAAGFNASAPSSPKLRMELRHLSRALPYR